MEITNKELLDELIRLGYTEEEIANMELIDVIRILQEEAEDFLAKIKRRQKMKRVRAYAIETAGLYFWLNNLEDKEEEMKIAKIMFKDAITEKEAMEILGYKLLRLLESNGILRPFVIVALDDGEIEIHKANYSDSEKEVV